MSNSKPNLLQLLEQPHDNANERNLEVAPEKSCFMLLSVKNLYHESSLNTSKQLQFKTVALHQNPSPTAKIELRKFIGSRNFYSKFFDKLHVNVKPLYDILHDFFLIFTALLIWKHCFNKFELLYKSCYSDIT